MKVRIWLVRVLATWGVLTLLATIGLVSYMAYSFGPGNQAGPLWPGFLTATVSGVTRFVIWLGMQL